MYEAPRPFATGRLEVGDSQSLYWEEFGNPDGQPVVLLHGGPGAGMSQRAPRQFDPARYRVVQFDQRGCGRSTPSAAEADLAVNTTAHLVADIEKLREDRGIDRWLVQGGSWGATLAQAYTAQHPDRVVAVVLAAVTMSAPDEIRWLTRDVGRFFPEQWHRFRDAVPAEDRDGDLSAAYARLLSSPDPAVRDQAARDWCTWEDAVMSAEPGFEPDPRFDDPQFRLVFARLVTHYFSHAGFLADGELLEAATRHAGIPALFVHGKLDLGGPAWVAWQLARAWPGSELVLVDAAGHTGAGIGDVIVAWTDALAR